MKIAATKALADLAKQDVPDEVSTAYWTTASVWKRLYYT